MQLAIVAAGFTPGEADQLRRAMAAWRRNGELERFEQRLIGGMIERGYSAEFAERHLQPDQRIRRIRFSRSRTPRASRCSVYVSAWLKRYEPAAFCCALLNSQPMGFYAPQQLVRSARDHGVEVRPVDVEQSDWDCTLERSAEGDAVVRLGMRLVKGLAKDAAARLLEARAAARFAGVQDLAERAQLNSKDLGALASAGALGALASHRHRARWEVAGVEQPMALLERVRFAEALPILRRPTEGEDIAADYAHIGVSLGRHPLTLLRPRLTAAGISTAHEVAELAPGARVRSAGLVITRQRPSSAAGVTFVTLEDETGYLNIVVWERLAQRARRALLGATLLGVCGVVQKESGVLHVIAERLVDHSELLGKLVTRSRDFH